MCLYVTSEKLKRLRSKVVDGKITCYKLVEIANDKKLQTPYRKTIVKPGYLKAEGNLDKCKSWTGLQIYGGAIHVYTNAKQMRGLCYDGRVVMKVMCYAKDLIAEGLHGQAAFTKIFIPKSEYVKAIKKVGL